MTVDLILHGVPNGQDIWGVSDDTHYISTFYVQKEDKETLSIETRKVSGKSYCYYNYLKYNGVTASDGRAGAYLGITLRFDAYYKDILNVYHLCEIVYNNLLDTILIKNGESVKFKIAKFEEAENELVEIKKKLFNLINLSATAKDFVPINDTFFSNDSKIVKAFLLDCTPDNVMQALVKYGKVEISKYYPSVNEAKKLKGIEERYMTTIAQKDKDLQKANLQIGDLTSESQRLQSNLQDKINEINTLNRLISEKEDTIRNNEEAIKEVSTYINKSKELQSELDSTSNENEQLKVLISKMENTIKRNEHAVKESEAMKHQIQELKSYIQKQNREIEQIKTELIEGMGNQPLSLKESNNRRSHKKNNRNKGRQFLPDNTNNNDYYSEDTFSDSSRNSRFLEKISHYLSLPLWQKITVVIIALTLICSSIVLVVKLCSSEDNKPNVEQATKVSYIKDIEDSSNEPEYDIEDVDKNTSTNTYNDDDDE